MAQTIQRSFTGGELAPALRARADMVKYSTGLALCQNMIIRSQGGTYSRPGWRFVDALDDSTRRGRLIPFSFNTEQTYILVFEHLLMRVVKDGGLVLVGGGPSIFELVTPYTEAQLPDLAFTQSADVMTIVHPDHDPANLSRTADDAWSLDDIDYSPGITPPVFLGSLSYVITDISLTDPAVVEITDVTDLDNGDVITVTDVVGMTEVNNRSFTVANLSLVNGTFELQGEDATAHTAYVSGGVASLAGAVATIGDGGGDFTKTYTYVVTAVDADGVESIASSPASLEVDSLSVTFGVRLKWAAVTGAEYYRVYKDPSVNTASYGWIGDSNNTRFDDYNKAPISSDAPPEDRQPFSTADNKPSAVTYFQQRQVFANTNNEPQAVYTTQTGRFNSLRTSRPARDDDAVTFTVAAQQVNEIRHMISLDSLILLTSGGEWKVTEGQDQVLTPSTIGARPQSYNGASKVPPVIINSTALYVQNKGTKLRDLGYDFSSDKYTGNDLSLMAEHLFEGFTIEEMTYAEEPYGIVWCVRSDGVLLGLTYQREHQVWAWHQHITDGTVESVATIVEGDRDATYLIVKRTINGVDRRYIERMEPRFTDAPENVFCVDSGLSYDGVPITTVTGLSHLEGKPVGVVADGNVVTGLTVTGGQIELLQAASKIHVGLEYLPAMELLDVDIASGDRSLKGRDVSVSKVILELQDSRGGFVGPKNDDGSTGEMEEIKPRFDVDGYGTLPLKNYKAEVFIQDDWSKGGGIRIEQRAPLPLAVLAVIPDVSVGGI